MYEKNDNDASLYFHFCDILNITKRIKQIPPQSREAEKGRIIDELKKSISENITESFLQEEDYNYIYNHLLDTMCTSVFFCPDPNVFIYQLINNKKFDDDVLEIFVRFNQGGVPLTKSDLIFSTLKLQWREAGDLFEKLEKATDIDKDMLLKTLMIISEIRAGAKLSEAKNKIDDLKKNFENFQNIIEKFHDRIREVTEQHERIYNKFNFINFSGIRLLSHKSSNYHSKIWFSFWFLAYQKNEVLFS